MKKITQNLRWLVTLLAMIVCTGAWAEDVTVDISLGTSSLDWSVNSNYDDARSASKDGIDLLYNKAESSTATSGGMQSAHIRFYQGSQFTVSCSNGEIKKIVFTPLSSYSTSNLMPNSGTIKSNTWTGSASTIVFSLSVQVRLSKIVVTYASASGKQNSQIAWSTSEASATMGNNFNNAPTLSNPYSLPVTYNSSDTGVATIGNNGAITLVGAGTTTISAEFVGNDTYDAKTVSYTLTVSKQDVEMSFSETSFNVDSENTASFVKPTLTTNPEGLSVTYSSNNENVATVDGSTGDVTIVGIGTTTITARFAGNNTFNENSASYVINVYDPNVKGTEFNPYTVAEALAVIENLGTASSDVVYVKGVVSNVESISTTSTTARYYISDDGTTTSGQLYVYNGKYLNNVNFTSETTIEVFDNVVICGKLKNYKGNKPEFDAGNYIYSLTRKEDPNLSFEISECRVEINGTLAAPTLTNEHNLTVTYQSSDESIVSVNSETGELTIGSTEGTVTITATSVATDTYKPGNASYTITVYDPNAKGTEFNPFTVAEVINGTATGTGIYVLGYIVGEYVGNTTNPRTSDFNNDGNIAIADVFTTSPSASASIPVQLNKDALKTAWGNLANNGSKITYQVLVKGNIEKYFTVNGIKSTSEVTAKAVNVSVSDIGYATAYYSDVKLKVPEGTEAYTYTVVEGGNAYSTTFSAGETIKAGEAVVVYKQGGGNLRFEVSSETPKESTNNMLKGTDKAAVTTGGTYYYALSLNASGDENSIGFYWMEENGEAFESGAHKAYLALDNTFANLTGGTVKSYYGFGNSTTAIQGIDMNASMKNAVIYNLAGQRVSAPVKGNMYIVNGKKVMMK